MVQLFHKHETRISISPPRGARGSIPVTTNAKVIRSERYAEIGSIVQRDAATLIDEWAKRAVEDQPNARRVHHSVLLNDMSSFLWELGQHLASAVDAGSNRLRRSAIQHGEQRWVT